MLEPGNLRRLCSRRAAAGGATRAGTGRGAKGRRGEGAKFGRRETSGPPKKSGSRRIETERAPLAPFLRAKREVLPLVGALD